MRIEETPTYEADFNTNHRVSSGKYFYYDERGAVFQEGEYIASKNSYNHRINLYSLYDFFVEVWYFPPENRITDIKVINDDKILDIYIDKMIKVSDK